MPRYYFHLASSDLLRDEIGEEWGGITEVSQAARRSAAELIAEQIVRGEPVDLEQRITVEGDNGVVMELKFSDLFTRTRRER